MKFCPKCSLKIKGNLTQCPICKVELLSCAEDEEVTAQVTNEDHQERIINKMDNILSTESSTQDKKHTIDTRKPVRRKEADKTRDSEDYSYVLNRMKELENSLNDIENKFNITSSKSDVFNIAMVDLESRITKLDQSLGEMKKSLGSPHKRIKDIEEEISRLVVHIDHLDEDLESVKNNLKDQQDKINKLSEECRISMKVSEETRDKIKNLEAHAERPSPSLEERQAKSDLPPGRIEISDEGIKFTESKGKDLENEFESYFSPLSEEEFPQLEREWKKNFPIIIISLILAAVIISSWFTFRYLKSQKQNAHKEVIAQRIEIPPIPEEKALDTSPKSSKIQPTQKAATKEKNLKPKVLSKESTLISRVLAKKQSQPPKDTETRRAALKQASGYTINVGSFRDKERAHRFTKKLIDKGYPVLMSPSKKNKWYKVRVGAFSTVKEARAYSLILEKKEKLPTFITEINKP
ncbi:MAG: hypothetical protein AMJ42_01390 [Deltaproteobacteria bacterium DG_8]|nr:MAG: hypothetical protein AMJ42_01390 [Deltaproteobacteria bacterium DG_8]